MQLMYDRPVLAQCIAPLAPRAHEPCIHTAYTIHSYSGLDLPVRPAGVPAILLVLGLAFRNGRNQNRAEIYVGLLLW